MRKIEWKKIEGQPHYSISNTGIVRSDRYNRVLKSNNYNTRTGKNDGYANLAIKGKNYKIHRLLALTFIPNPENKECVNHIDGDKTNNSLDNLEWCTYKENMEHARDEGLLNDNLSIRVRATKGDEVIDFPSVIEARRQGYSWWMIDQCVKGIKDKYKGYTWEYFN